MSIGETHFAIMGPCASALLFDELGVCLTEAFSKADAVRGKREAFKAYLVLTSFLIDSLKGGFVAAAKRKLTGRASNSALHSAR